MTKLQKRVQALLKLGQLMVQETVAVMEERYQAQAKEREEARISQANNNADSTVGSANGANNTAPSGSEEERLELSIKEQVEFAGKVVESVILKYGPEIAQRA